MISVAEERSATVECMKAGRKSESSLALELPSSFVMHVSTPLQHAAPASAISRTPPLDLQLTATSPMRMQTSMSCRRCSVSSGRAQRQSPLEKRSHIWASAGTYARRWYTYQTRKKQNTWWQLRSGKKSRRTTSLKPKGSTENYSTLLWLSQRDALTSPTWRPCSPPSTTVLSFHTHPRGGPQTTWPGGSVNSGAQTSPSPSLGPAPSSNTECSPMQNLVSAL